MTDFELGNILKEMYDNAPRGEQVTAIHLFGIEYAKDIRDNKITSKEILTSAGMPTSYQAEINKGVNLAKYVSLK